MESINIIQSMLAPAIMISCCGLLFLGLQNRYGRIVDRLRQFNRERINCTPEVLEVLKLQIKQLSLRGKLQRNALSCILFAVMFFILTSLFIAVGMKIAVYFFLIGMAAVLVGVVCAWIELVISYKTVMTETNIIQKSQF